MSPYLGITELIARFGENEITQLSDRANSGIYDEAVVQTAIDDASAEAEGYLRIRYTLPLPEIPALLTKLVADLARHELYDQAPPPVVEERRASALRQLRDIGAGRLRLFPEATTPSPVEGVQIAPAERLFTPHTLRGF